MPTNRVIGFYFFVFGAGLFDDEDGAADLEGVVEELGGGLVIRGVGREGRAEGEDGGAGGWEEGDFVGGGGGVGGRGHSLGLWWVRRVG